jgi:3-hydroxybutyryl-CoA dehydrogenase
MAVWAKGGKLQIGLLRPGGDTKRRTYIRNAVLTTAELARGPTSDLAITSGTLRQGRNPCHNPPNEKVLVAHYFNPPYLLPLVEIVRGAETSDETVEAVCSLLRTLGKHPAIVRKEVPGFIGNRLQAALIREAISLVQNGVASAEDVDTVIRYGFGRRLAAAGVFENFDLAG